jgi:hypothetical protein
MMQQKSVYDFNVPSAHNPDNRFHPKFDGKNWSCDCRHFKEYKTHCRHILEKRLELKNRGMFNGPNYEPMLDEIRLQKQLARIFTLMTDGEWRTLKEIQEETGDPAASISAQLRHLRKKRFGSHTVDKRHSGDDTSGLWEYRLIVNKDANVVVEGNEKT